MWPAKIFELISRFSIRYINNPRRGGGENIYHFKTGAVLLVLFDEVSKIRNFTKSIKKAIKVLAIFSTISAKFDDSQATRYKFYGQNDERIPRDFYAICRKTENHPSSSRRSLQQIPFKVETHSKMDGRRQIFNFFVLASQTSAYILSGEKCILSS